jgi:2-phospho-L-lactate/phosphoenolpyruvate guanylyltransferase
VQVLIPVNELERAKGRLADVLDAPARVRLFLATVTTVVDAALAAGMTPVILTRDPRIAAQFGSQATILDEDRALSGLNAQLESAIRRLQPAGVPAELLILHADLPLASAAALRDLAGSAPPAPSVTLVRSADGGTNAMLLRPPGKFPLAYGSASFARHRTAALAAGMTVHEVDLPPLALDLDTASDIETLLATPAGPQTPAGRVLVSLGFARAPSP